MNFRAFFLSVCCPLLGISTLIAEEVDYTRDVRPILSGRCFKCHGPDPETREAGLRLDEAIASRAELDSGERAVVPGDIEASQLLTRITTSDDSLRMPPADQGPALTPQEIETLKRWLESGAKYDKHWSFVAPKLPELPDVSNPDWCRNDIDRFILNKLDSQKLKPSPEADRSTLIRRLSLDLTGLPPSPEEIKQFINDTSPQAYERLVDRLLASPAYGERLARIWLDLARYADSAGYADDPPRVIWKYRDWVIDAINEDMPIDQFTIEQLAGDLLPNPTEEQLIATAFHRNTMTNSEGGTDDEEFRSAAVVDRVNTTMQVWMGLTMACAQCHTHKYDPITHEEYFNVYAILNQTEDADKRDESPLLNLWTPELEEQKASLQAKIDGLKTDLEKLQQISAKEEPTLKLADGPIQARFVRIDLPGKTEFLSLAEVQVFSENEQVAVGKKATQSSTGYNGTANLAVDGNTDGDFFESKSTTHTNRDASPWWEVDLGATYQIDRISVWNRNDSPNIGKRLDDFRVVLLDEKRNPTWAKSKLKSNKQETEVHVPDSTQKLADDERAAIAEYLGANSPEVAKLKKQITATETQLKNIKPVTVPIMRALPEEKHRKTHIHVRGNFLDLGPEVSAGLLKEFHRSESSNPDRLDFAKWLIDPQNPLSARVFANRYWEILFGIGLVETSEDFGMQGDYPSHPELLDWLAIQLKNNGWSRKQFLKLIVMSATYRQSSAVDAELVARDPKNRLLARGPRFRLSAEMIRDQALSISGLLSRKMHGPSVNPPRPKLGLRAAFGGSTDWETSKGEDKFRRGIYTTWRRSLPYPSMDAFDAPSREVCTVRRIRTNTPLQALVTLNDPVYIEAAQALAGRILSEGGATQDEQLTYGFLLCTARQPTEQELNVLRSTFESLREKYTNEIESAQKLKVIGSRETEKTPVEIQASWTVLSNVLLNLDETLTNR
ncbi:DUF1553 domain-containing protein [Thalassoglobus polymorphus]|uniref:Planctomycete cytochrome C n=1 Tax=Thalassoglobus polymorphus TaxID=2527994 RepID=A0A517QV59_9PLAN|nr:DUF1553 domain-containing protein [Thalassoglobus polymorphus]QDT35518.1 Planctomycete cytochrome C [Thalassoglobus polymorphus]